MPPSLLAAVRGHPFIFVAGKGGVGKTTAAAALAVGIADRGLGAHLISTDPAHSLGDFFGAPVGGSPRTGPCGGDLLIEEFGAAAYARAWSAEAGPRLLELIEHGTYLRAAEAGEFRDLSIPGVDEVMAAFRLAELADGGRTVLVDTAPTGHTLRLLDAADVVDGWTAALRAMADKAAVVASSLAGRPARLSAEELLERVEQIVRTFRERVLAAAAFVVVHREGAVVAAETRRLLDALRARRLRVAALVATGGAAAPPADGAPAFDAPLLARPTGCDGARAWLGSLRPGGSLPPAPAPIGRPASPASDARSWLEGLRHRLLLVAGKGGVGKSTCAAAAALALAGSRRVLLCSTDPAGSLADLLEVPVPAEGAVIAPGLRALQIDAAGALEALRVRYREEVHEVFARAGLDEALRMDREIIERLWGLAPPGMDEVVALFEMLEALDGEETLVIDAAPTGHFLRLLAMPGLALSWVRALMRVLQQVRVASLDATVERLIRLSKRLKQLDSELTDGTVSGVLLVTLAEPLVRAETERLRASLAAARVHVLASIVNRDGGGSAAAGRDAAELAAVTITAPAVDPPPVGRAALHRFLDSWRVLT